MRTQNDGSLVIGSFSTAILVRMLPDPHSDSDSDSSSSFSSRRCGFGFWVLDGVRVGVSSLGRMGARDEDEDESWMKTNDQVGKRLPI